MSSENEEIIRRAYQCAEDKDIEGWVNSFTPDGTSTDQSIGVLYSVRTSWVRRSRTTRWPSRQVRSADFLDAEHFPNITFASTAVVRRRAGTSSTETSRSVGRRAQ